VAHARDKRAFSWAVAHSQESDVEIALTAWGEFDVHAKPKMRLGPISRSDLIKRLRALDGMDRSSAGSIQHMVRGNLQLTIPNPHRGDVGVNLLKIILKEAGISRDEWIRRR
jgi:hypothetical protein